jgi:hypothetical protein
LVGHLVIVVLVQLGQQHVALSSVMLLTCLEHVPLDKMAVLEGQALLLRIADCCRVCLLPGNVWPVQ